jgi:organic radical activating enzyme
LHKQAVLYVHDNCSYDCSYCLLNQSWFERRADSKASSPEGREAIIRFFTERPGWNIILTGGEPTELPGFVELARDLSKNNRISLDTNNSMEAQDLDYFTREVPVDRVGFIRCSLHQADEGARFQDWLARVMRFRDLGYRAFVTWVAVQEKMDMLPELHWSVTNLGIPFVVTPLVTDKFPGAYSSKERELMDRYMSSAVFRTQLDRAVRAVKGKLCAAGSTRIKVNCISGDILSCFRASSPVIGNIYRNELKLETRPQPCPWDSCSWFLEPHLAAEELFRRDLENILGGQRNYDREILRELSSII